MGGFRGFLRFPETDQVYSSNQNYILQWYECSDGNTLIEQLTTLIEQSLYNNM